MINDKRNFWLTLCLVNLCIVALLGFTLRSKILFSLPFIDFRNVESAHSHFAFAGWVGLTLMTLLVYDILPEPFNSRNVYQWILTAIEISSLGMALLFPFFGYRTITILFSDLYVVAAVVFTFTYIRDVLKTVITPAVRLLSISAVLSLMLSFLGTAGLAYIIVTGSGGSLLYRDSIYTFLHFQYNGFFTLSVFALLVNRVVKKGIELPGSAKWFSVFLCLSVVPSMFLSLLWHNLILFYVLAAIGCLFSLITLFYFLIFLKFLPEKKLFLSGMAKTFWRFSMASFLLKMLLQVGTIFPGLGNAVYGDRPVIIGFLHLVFLGFVSFFILAGMIERRFFTTGKRTIKLPLIWFAFGIFVNEFFLMLQGAGVLFQTNSDIYQWLLWGAGVILFSGAVGIAISRIIVVRAKK